VSWYRKAAEQGNAKAQNNLGIIYATGKGVPQDYVIAHMWFNLAAVSGDKSDNAAENRDKAAAKMTPAQVAEAQKLAREWKPK
jgi:TPR repeat protein